MLIAHLYAMISRDEYYRMLGLSPQATFDEVRKAYRIKAKMLHPDVSKLPDAHEQFLKISEAYAYIIDERSGRRRFVFRSSTVVTEEERRREARKKAAVHARMRYEEFMKSGYYRSADAISSAIDALIWLVLLSLLPLLPLWAYRLYKTAGLWVAIPLDLILAIVCIIIAGGNKETGVRKYFEAFGYLLRWRPFYAVVFSVFSLVIFLRIGLQTLIPLNLLLLLYVTFGVTLFLGLRQLGRRKIAAFAGFCILPLMLSLLLLVNYVFAGHGKEEQFMLKRTDWNSGESTLIYLEGDMYSEYPGLRLFWDYTKVSGANMITYRMEDGLLGFRVMKSYTLSRDEMLIP